MHIESEYIILLLGWSLWCFVHSLLISTSVTDFLRQHLRDAFKFYRLAFNLFAILSILPLAIYTSSLPDPTVFTWEGWLRIPQLLLIALGLWYLVGGARIYDLKQLLGIRQILTNNAHRTLDESGEITTRGILGVVRHPWYACTLLLIWTHELDAAAVTLNVVFSSYLIVGTVLEEGKLCREFGESYREYRQQVSMLFPWKYLRRKLRLASSFRA